MNCTLTNHRKIDKDTALFLNTTAKLGFEFDEKEEAIDMCKAMEDLREESIQRGIDQNRVESIKSIMKKLQYTAQQAMDLLEIPLKEQPKYTAKL